MKETAQLRTAAVWGIAKPVILLPASLIANCSMHEVEAILAHELAHIRRWDLAAELVQRLIESVFFFNPAVWWISRQVRLEREACCDALAVSVIQEPARYAAVLADAAERTRSAAAMPAVMAMTEGSNGHLLDRVRRILVPESRPEMRLSWGTCLILMLLVAGGLYLLQRGTDVAVAVAAQILSDEERVERLAEEAQQGGVVGKKPEFDTVSVSGEVLFAPGVSHGPAQFHSIVDTLRGTVSGTGNIKGSKFEDTVPAGTIWLIFNADGVAPSVLGPFGPQDGPTIKNLEVSLSPGLSVPVTVVDENGAPADGVKVTLSVMTPPGGIGVANSVTDTNGQATLQDVAPGLAYRLRLSGAGYQETQSRDGPSRLNGPLKFSIQRAVPASGVVVDQQGQPIPNVEIREFGRVRQDMVYSYGMVGDAFATTDADGRFAVDQLRDGYTYRLLLEHPDFVPAILADVHPGDRGLRASLIKGVDVKIVIDDQVGELGPRTRVSWSQDAIIFGGGSPLSRDVSGHARLTPQDGKLTTRIAHVRAGKLELTVNGQTETFEVAGEKTQVTFTYAGRPERETRQVILRFFRNGNQVQPRGRLHVYGASLGSAGSRRSHHWIPVEDGTVTFPVEPPMQVHTESDGLIGFWFNSSQVDWPRIEAGSMPVEIPIEVQPAGAVPGQVLRPDGRPAADVSVNCRVEISSNDPADGYRHYTGGQSTKTDADGRYFVTPIPFAAQCTIAISDGFYRQVGAQFTMSPDEVSPTISLTMHEKTSLSGQVLDPDGRPAASFPISLEYEHAHGSMSWGPPQLTDGKGQFQFAGVNSQPSGQYAIQINDQPGIQPLRVTLSAGAPNVIRLKKGLTVTGTVVDLNGDPVPGVEVYAHFKNFRSPTGYPPYINADKVTDAQGRFQLTTLPDLPMLLGARQLWDHNEPTVHPGRTTHLTIQGKIAPWYAEKLKSHTAND